jgi:hypothetical protein
MPVKKGPWWDYVDLLQSNPPKVQCNLCGHTFPGKGARILDHFVPDLKQVKPCTGDPATGLVPSDLVQQITEHRAAGTGKKRLREAQDAIEGTPRALIIRPGAGSGSGTGSGGGSGGSSGSGRASIGTGRLQVCASRLAACSSRAPPPPPVVGAAVAASLRCRIPPHAGAHWRGVPARQP